VKEDEKNFEKRVKRLEIVEKEAVEIYSAARNKGCRLNIVVLSTLTAPYYTCGSDCWIPSSEAKWGSISSKA